MSGKFDNVVMNDINDRIVKCFEDSVMHEYSCYQQFVDRHKFHSIKGYDTYVALCYSFGNDMRSYMYGEKVEYIHHVLHDYIVFCEKPKAEPFNRLAVPHSKDTDNTSIHQRLLDTKMNVRKCAMLGDSFRLLPSIERMLRVSEIYTDLRNRCDDIAFTSMDYRDVIVNNNSVIYCDIPYENTTVDQYGNTSFDYKEFYKWADTNKNPVFVSSYTAPDCVYEIGCKHRFSHVQHQKRNNVTERLFCNKAALDLLEVNNEV